MFKASRLCSYLSPPALRTQPLSGSRGSLPRGSGDIRWDDGPWNDKSRRSWRDYLPVTYSGLILLICVIFFGVSLIDPRQAYNYLALNPALVYSRPWTLVTHMFMHASFDHLFWNMLFLFFFGTQLERRIGENRFLEVFMLSGLVAAAGQMLVSTGFMVGASGALYGVLGCLAILAPEITVLLFFVIPLRIQYAVVLFAILDFTMMGSADNIAHMAHISGLLVGLAFGYMLKGKQSQHVYHYSR
ncbi:MAG: rhomboid family intramembrane serine protease [Methanosarcinales archaeon]|nr:rhomboid family intramembrane serine protease [Methanosarcinales archaeon]